MKLRLLAKVLAAGTLAVAAVAHAAPILRISDGTTTVTVADGAAGSCGDTNALANVVGINCAIGSWLVNFVLGVGHDVLGNEIHLTSANMSSSAGGALTVMLTDTDFVNTGAYPSLAFWGGIGGVTPGSVNYAMYVSDANTPFGLDTLIGSGAGSGAFSATFSNWASPTGTYSMTLVATIVHGWSNFPQATSLDFVGRVPEPGVLALLATGLLGVGLAARRRKN